MYAGMVSRLGSTQNPQLASVPMFYRSQHVNKLVAQAHANNSHQIYASSSLLKRSQTPTQPLEKHSTQDKALWDRCHVLKTRDLFVIENDLRIT